MRYCVNVCVILSNAVYVLLFGRFLSTNELRFLQLSTTILFGYNTVGLTILIEVGVPNSYLVTLELVGKTTLTGVPLASTCSIFANEERSIVPVRFVQFYIENVIRFLILDKFILVIPSVVELNADPSNLIPCILGKYSSILCPLYIRFYKPFPTVVQVPFKLY